ACERTGGAPLAAMHKQLTLSVCKRRDAVRLGLHEPARPAGAAFGVLSGATVSWAAPMHRAPLLFSFIGRVTSWRTTHLAVPQRRSRCHCVLRVRRILAR